MVVLLLPITPLYCTSQALGFYFRVVVTIRVHLVLPVVIAFWLRLDCLIKPCFLPALLLLSLYIMLVFTHAASHSLMNPYTAPYPPHHLCAFTHPCVLQAHTFPCFAPLYISLCASSCLLEPLLFSGSVCGSSPL
jgi:hypothetical protein